jgi:hypothetical protein
MLTSWIRVSVIASARPALENPGTSQRTQKLAVT